MREPGWGPRHVAEPEAQAEPRVPQGDAARPPVPVDDAARLAPPYPGPPAEPAGPPAPGAPAARAAPASPAAPAAPASQAEAVSGAIERSAPDRPGQSAAPAEVAPRRSIAPLPAPNQRIAANLLRVAFAVAVAYAGLGIGLTYWQVAEAERLSRDPNNPLVIAAARSAPRGAIRDVNGTVLARNVRGPSGESLRQYTYPVMASVIGYRSQRFGAAGLERTYDAQLTGLVALGAADELLRKFRPDPYDPNDLHLSIDLRLQSHVAQLLGGDRGAVVALEPSTGRVLALVSSPSYDPNRLIDPATGEAYLESLRGRDSSPLLNRATQGRYVPGSVYKIVTALAGLGSGAITPETTYENQPEEYRTGFRVEGFRIRDAPRNFQTDHPLDFYEATEVSSNIWYAHAGLDIGPADLLDWSRRLGFGAPIPFELPTAASQVTGGGGPLEGFTDSVELANAAYGQGELLVTPLQMALVAGTVANGGVLMRPKLVDALVSENGRTTRIDAQPLRRVVSPEVAAVVRDAMQRAVEGEFGQLFAGGAKIPGVSTAGKSGSAQVGDGRRPHSWFIGFAPVESPRIAVAVIVERAGLGSQRAVPLGGDVMEFYLDLPDQ